MAHSKLVDGLTEETMANIYKGMAGTCFNKLFQDLAATFFANSMPEIKAECARIMFEQIKVAAIVARGDGVLSDPEVKHLIHYAKQINPQINIDEFTAYLRSDDCNPANLEREIKKLEGEVYSEGMKGEAAQYANVAAWQKDFPLIICFGAMLCAAQDGLSQSEFEKAAKMAQLVSVGEDQVKEMLELIKLEQELVVILDSVFASEDAGPPRLAQGGSVAPHKQVKRQLSDEQKENGPPPAKRAKTDEAKGEEDTKMAERSATDVRSQLTPENIHPSYRGRAGYSFIAYDFNRLGDIRDPLAPWATAVNAGDPKLLENILKAVCIVARRDGQLSDVEERKLREECTYHDNVDHTKVLAANVADFEAVMREVENGIAAVSEKLALVEHVQNWKTFVTKFRYYILKVALRVSLQDGLPDSELENVYTLGNKLDIPRSVVDVLLECFRIEQEICRRFCALYGFTFE